MNHAGEIAALTAQVRPHVAVITTIAPAHIENLGSEEAIADAKAEIFDGLEPGGTAVIPADSPHFARLRARGRGARARSVVSFGRAAARARPPARRDPVGQRRLAGHRRHSGDRRLCYSVAEPGEHWVTNSLAVMAAVHAAGGDLGAAGLALAEMGGLKGRGARHRLRGAGRPRAADRRKLQRQPRLDARDAGAARRDAGRAAHRGARQHEGARRLRARRSTPQLAEPLAEAGVDYAILVGDEMPALARELGKSGAERAWQRASPSPIARTRAKRSPRWRNSAWPAATRSS